MKNQNIVVITLASALAFALAPLTGAQPSPQGGPTSEAAPANHQASFGDVLTEESTLRATPTPRPAPSPRSANQSASSAYAMSPEDVQLPAITIYSAGDVARGKTGSFVLKMNPSVAFGGTYVNFKVSGTAVAGVDYVPLISPAYIGQSGYATILVYTLADPRGPSDRQAYSVVVTLEAGAGYALGVPNSATIWIKP